MWILGLLQIATIYCGTFQQFLAVRSLFGLFMGGVYGNAVAMALENCPVDARGLMSGIVSSHLSLRLHASVDNCHQRSVTSTLPTAAAL
jgi:MFS family permease